MSKQINPRSLKIAKELIDNIQMHEKLGIETIVFRQIERTCQAVFQGELIFSSHVRLLMNMIPSHKKEEVESRSEEYINNVKRYEYKYFCGVPMGTVKHPVNGSPFIIEEEVIDWNKIFEIVLETFEDCGITWRHDSLTVEVGKIGDNFATTPTPVFTKGITPQVEELVPKEEKRVYRTCAVCGQRVLPKTGRIYKCPDGKKKLVHIDKCYEALKSNWTEN